MSRYSFSIRIVKQDRLNYRIEQLEAIFADHPPSQTLSQLLRELKERRQ